MDSGAFSWGPHDPFGGWLVIFAKPIIKSHEPGKKPWAYNPKIVGLI